MAAKETENEVYRQLSADMRDGLKHIYQQISSVSSEDAESSSKTEQLFSEASDQLKEVVKTTESATMSIMDIVEKQLEFSAESGEIIGRLKARLGDDPDLERLSAINDNLGNDLTAVLTALSFQDITGQRIKKVMAALNAIERGVLELYLSSGLVMEGAARDPAKDAATLRAEAQKAVEDYHDKRTTELKGPDKNAASQDAIDDMLAQLGL